MSGRTEDPVEIIDDDEPTGLDTETKVENQPVVEEEEDPEEYVVEDIRARKRDPKTGNDLYLVKWEGYPESDNTWEPAENLKCPEVVQRFLEKEANKRKRKKIEKNHANDSSVSKSQSQSAVKRPKRTDGNHSRIFVEDESTEEENDCVNGVTATTPRQKQKLAAPVKEPTPEPAPKGFERGLDIEKILTASVGDNDKMYFFVKWQGLSELELVEVDELEKNASLELCRWYRERFFCNIKYNKLPA